MLDPTTILQRAPNIRVSLIAGSDLQIMMDGEQLSVGSHGLAVLDAFARPCPVSKALDVLQARSSGVLDWMDLMNTIVQLHKAGVLQDEIQAGSGPSFRRGGFHAPDVHLAMLNDRVRTATFLKGIEEVVRPGDVVVDIGTGTGVLAIAAARAGARHVYAIEASTMGPIAESMFAANGFADRITLVPGWSTQVTLPERANVLVSEIIGNEPLAERVMELTSDAAKRLLTPDARMVPGRIRLFALPVTVPDSALAERVFTPETVRNWESWYGINFDRLSETARSTQHLFYVRPQDARAWPALSEPVLLADVDLRATSALTVEHTTTVAASAVGELNGLLVYFELQLGPTAALSTHPARAANDNHWRSPVWAPAEALSLREGETFRVTYKYRVAGSRDGVSVSRDVPSRATA